MTQLSLSPPFRCRVVKWKQTCIILSLVETAFFDTTHVRWYKNLARCCWDVSRANLSLSTLLDSMPPLSSFGPLGSDSCTASLRFSDLPTVKGFSGSTSLSWWKGIFWLTVACPFFWVVMFQLKREIIRYLCITCWIPSLSWMLLSILLGSFPTPILLKFPSTGVSNFFRISCPDTGLITSETWSGQWVTYWDNEASGLRSISGHGMLSQ